MLFQAVMRRTASNSADLAVTSGLSPESRARIRFTKCRRKAPRRCAKLAGETPLGADGNQAGARNWMSR